MLESSPHLVPVYHALLLVAWRAQTLRCSDGVQVHRGLACAATAAVQSFPTIRLYPKAAKTAGEGIPMTQTPWTWTYDDAEVVQRVDEFIDEAKVGLATTDKDEL